MHGRSADGGAGVGSRMITVDRVAGVVVALAGVWLLVWGIPMNVPTNDYEYPSPRLFPSIGAWIFVVGGIAQAVLVKSGTRLPSLRDFGRYMMVSAMLVAMVGIMETFGYLVGAVALLAGLMLVVFERRIHWIVIAVLIVPVTLWFLFEIVLERPLP